MYVNREGRRGKNTDLSREVSRTQVLVEISRLRLKTIYREKSAEAIVGASRRAEQCNRVIKCMLHGVPDGRKGET